MAQKLELKNRPGSEGRISVGANMQFLVDGKPLKGVRKVTIEAEARKVAKVTIEMLGEIDTHVLGFYQPVKVFKKRKRKEKV